MPAENFLRGELVRWHGTSVMCPILWNNDSWVMIYRNLPVSHVSKYHIMSVTQNPYVDEYSVDGEKRE